MTQEIDVERAAAEGEQWIGQIRTILEGQYRLYQLTLENSQKLKVLGKTRPYGFTTGLTLEGDLRSLSSLMTQSDLRLVRRLRRTTKNLGWDSLLTVMAPLEAEKFASEHDVKGARMFGGLLVKHAKIIKEMNL